jgi:CpeT protein
VRLHRWLSGSFDSVDQAAADPAYFEITLAVCPVSAPELGSRVLYVEQAKLGSAPYRQRLYVVDPLNATSAVSRVFELAAPEAAVGTCTKATPITFAAKDAEVREGCEVVLEWKGDRFEGGTPPDKCKSTLSGASYATTEVTIRSDGLVSWDRGWTAAKKQVWGATKGGYTFVRRDAPPPL